jgi:AbrB family looped-hinge helix DNA binding protein
MSQKNVPVRMAANGRLSVPARLRKALGLEAGGVVVLTLQEGEIRIRPIRTVLNEVQAMVAPYLKSSGDTVEQFLADKRAEVAREETEYERSKASRRQAG